MADLLKKGRVSIAHVDALASEIDKLDHDRQQANRRIDAEVKARRTQPEHRCHDRAQLSAIALVNLVTGARTTSRVPATVAVHISLPPLLDTPGADKFGEYSDGTPVPAETIRRHACDAHIIPVVVDGERRPLDVGLAQRLATPEQRTALRSMHPTCAIDGCNTTSTDARSTTSSNGPPSTGRPICDT
jgi:hypothetical protein